MSSSDVNQVTETVKQIAEVGDRARRLNESMKNNLAEISAGLDIGEDVDRSLKSAAAALRGAFGAQTNNPPKDDPSPAPESGAATPGDGAK